MALADPRDLKVRHHARALHSRDMITSAPEEQDADRTILLPGLLYDPLGYIGILAHELLHAVLDEERPGHSEAFARGAEALGLQTKGGDPETAGIRLPHLAPPWALEAWAAYGTPPYTQDRNPERRGSARQIRLMSDFRPLLLKADPDTEPLPDYRRQPWPPFPSVLSRRR